MLQIRRHLLSSYWRGASSNSIRQSQVGQRGVIRLCPQPLLNPTLALMRGNCFYHTSTPILQMEQAQRGKIACKGHTARK